MSAALRNSGFHPWPSGYWILTLTDFKTLLESSSPAKLFTIHIWGHTLLTFSVSAPNTVTFSTSIPEGEPAPNHQVGLHGRSCTLSSKTDVGSQSISACSVQSIQAYFTHSAFNKLISTTGDSRIAFTFCYLLPGGICSASQESCTPSGGTMQSVSCALCPAHRLIRFGAPAFRSWLSYTARTARSQHHLHLIWSL